MSDERVNVINEIKIMMLDDLDDCQIQKLDRILISVLRDYDIQKMVTALVPYDDSNERAMKFFFGKLKLDGKADGTIEQYRRATENMFYAIGKNFSDITYFDILDYFAQLSVRLKKVSYNNYIVYINQFFTWLHDEGAIPTNPIKKINRVKVDREIKKSFTSAERACLRDHAKTIRDKALLEVLYSTSCRISEIVGANISDISGDELTVWSPKTKSEIVVYLDDSARYYLNFYLESRTDNNDALFVTLTNKPGTKEPGRLTKSAAERICRELGNVCNIRTHPHKFRRTKATDLLNSGMPLQEVQKILNHKSPDTTTRYFCPNNKLIKSDFMRHS